MGTNNTSPKGKLAPEPSWEQLLADAAGWIEPQVQPRYAANLPAPSISIGYVTLGAGFIAKLTREAGTEILTAEEVAEVRRIQAKVREIEAALRFWNRAGSGNAVHSMLANELKKRVSAEGAACLTGYDMPSPAEFQASARIRKAILARAWDHVQEPLKRLARLAAERLQTAAAKVLAPLEAKDREEAARWGLPYRPSALVENLRLAAKLPGDLVPAEGEGLTVTARGTALLAWTVQEEPRQEATK